MKRLDKIEPIPHNKALASPVAVQMYIGADVMVAGVGIKAFVVVDWPMMATGCRHSVF